MENNIIENNITIGIEGLVGWKKSIKSNKEQ